jgi:ABC-type phosphate transport system substrate-binding protein
MSAFKQSMRKLGIRAGLLAGTSLAVVAIAGVGASSASAACAGSIEGQGSSLQKVAQQEIWSNNYKTAGCPTGGAEAVYTSSSSGTGLNAWGFNGAATLETKWKYIGTDDGPSSTQITNAEAAAHTTGGGNARVVTVPVAQTAIAIMVHPPTGCTVNEITNVHLEEVFSGDIQNWSSLGTGCTGTITRIVRAEGSGTTYQFKNYLALVNKSKNGGTEKAICTSESPTTKWTELEEIGAGGTPNTTWPTCSSASAPKTAAGGGKLAEEVKEHEGYIGYVALPDAKKQETTEAKVIKVQNNGTGGSPITIAPNKEEEARCGTAQYTVPTNGLRSESGIEADWSKVFGGNPSIGGETYPICTLTYDLGWTKKAVGGTSGFEEAGLGAGIGGKVAGYYEYILKTKKLGTGTSKKYYANLPTTGGAGTAHDIQDAAEWAMEQIN